MRHSAPQLKIRLKPEVKEWLENSAKQEDRSQTWLINHYLEQVMQREQKETV